MKRTAWIIILCIAIVSCRKKEDRTCWKSWGEESEKTVDVGEFNKLKLAERMEFVLVQDTCCYLVLRGGANMLNLVDMAIDSDKTLSVTSRNKCNFLRGYKRKIQVEIHFRDMYNLYFEGSEPLTCKNTLQTNYLTLLIRDGAGPVTLDVESKEVWGVITHGWGDFTITGTTDYANFDVRSNGYCHAGGLQVNDSLYFISNTSANMYMSFDQADVRGEIIGNGSVYYTGTPSLLEVTNTGNGKLISEN